MKTMFSNRNDSMIQAEDLEVIKEQLIEPKRENLIGRQLLPFDNSDPVWAETVTYDELETAGEATVTHGNATDDVNLLTVNTTRSGRPVFEVSMGFVLKRNEIRAAKAQNTPLRSRKATEVNSAIARKEEEIVFSGVTNLANGLLDYGSDVDLAGLTNHNNWDSGSETAEGIIEDVNKLWAEMEKQDGFEGGALVLTPDAWSQAATTVFGSDKKTSALEAIKNKDWFSDGVFKTSQIPGGGGDIDAMVLDNREENMALVVPEDVQMQEPYQRGPKELYIEASMRIAGSIVHYDSSGSYAVLHTDDLLA